MAEKSLFQGFGRGFLVIWQDCRRVFNGVLAGFAAAG
jgi:hypothetical protein